MSALALKNEVTSLVDKMSERKLRYVFQFAQFIQQQPDDIMQPTVRTIERLPLGFLKDAKVRFADDWEMTEEELLAL